MYKLIGNGKDGVIDKLNEALTAKNDRRLLIKRAVPEKSCITTTWDEQDAPEGRWRSYGYEELTARDKTSLDIFWLKDKSLTDLDNLPEPDDLAEEIIENLEAGLNSFREVLAELQR